MQSLKTTSNFFQAVKAGKKTAEIRSFADRSFYVGERIILAEIDDQKALTFDQVTIEITHILLHRDYPEGLTPGYGMLSFFLVE